MVSIGDFYSWHSRTFLAAVGVMASIAAWKPSTAFAQPMSLSLANHAYVHVGGSSQFVQPQFTVSVWFKPTGPGENGGGTLVTCGQSSGTGNFLCSWWTGWQASSGRVLGMVVHEYATTARVVTSSAVIPLGQEANAAMSFDGTTVRLYINGVLDQEVPYGFTGVYYPTAPEVNIGAFLPESGYTFNRFDGQLDEVNYWARALSSNEIAAYVKCGGGIPATGLRMQIPFTSQSTSSTAGFGLNGSAVGAIAFGPQLGDAAAIVAQPAAASACRSVAATMSVQATGAAPLGYRWQWQPPGPVMPFIDLNNGVNNYQGMPTLDVSGATTSAVQIKTLRALGGNVRCVVSTACGGTPSSSAALLVCPADLNCDGVVDDADFTVFVAAYNLLVCEDPAMPSGCPADLNSDGLVDDEDFVLFVLAYNALLCS